MIGLLLWKEAQTEGRQRTVTLKETSILHMRFLQAEILKGPRTPERILRRRIQAAGKRMRKLGVNQAVLPENFAFQEQLEKCGVQPVSTLALRRRLAADWVRWLLESRGLSVAGTRVAVAASQLTGEAVRTITELSLRHRYVLLDVPYGGEDLCRQLRREYGVSLQLNLSKEQLEEAEAMVLFDRREDLRVSHPVMLPIYDEKVPLPPLVLPPVLEEVLPEGVDRVLMVAALQWAGVLRQEQIDFCGT